MPLLTPFISPHRFKADVDPRFARTALPRVLAFALQLIEGKLVPTSTSEEGKVFYYKMKADYHRYLAEFQVKRCPARCHCVARLFFSNSLARRPLLADSYAACPGRRSTRSARPPPRPRAWPTTPQRASPTRRCRRRTPSASASPSTLAFFT